MKQSISQRGNRRCPVQLTATAVGAALLLGSLAAQAQQADASQTVTVTGIRKGIEDAISVKRNADSIVEAISAEDIGKLPDASVAESISRLPGVATQRSFVTGKAQDISVRGMAPDFNGGLLNGREQASTGPSRSVSFDDYPAELLGSVVVYKTPDASLMGQGLASTIDLRTVRPLDFGGRNVVVNYRKEFNAKAEDVAGFNTGNGDRLALSYIDQFADRTLGVALGATHAKSKGGSRPNFNTWGGWVADVPYNGVNVKTPGGFTTDIETTDSTRDAAMAVLQYKPNAQFESTLDVFYSKGDFSLKKRGLEGPVGGLSAGANDTGGTLINATVSNGIATAGTFTNWKGVIRNHNEDYSDTVKSIGWGNKLKTGGWTLNGDLSHSEAVKDSVRYETTAGIPGNTTNAADTISYTGFDGSNLANVKYTSGLNYADPALIKLTDVQGWAGGQGVQDGYYANPKTTDKISSFRLSGKHDVSWGPIYAVDGGFNFSDRSKDRVTREGALVLIGALNPDGSVKDRLISADIPSPTVGVGGLTGIPTLNWDPAGSLGKIYNLNPWSDHDIVGKSWGVKEKLSTLYVKADVDGTLGGIGYRGNVGLQVVHTDQSASGFTVDQASCNGGSHQCTYTPYSAGTTYNNVLPSLNLSADLGGENVLRVGLGRTMARPNMEDMKGGSDFSVDSTHVGANGQIVPILKGSAGNPYLKPFLADALDISWEKYFGKKGYVSVAGFYKDLKSYILRESFTVDFAPYLTPGSQLPPSGSTVGLLTMPLNGSGGSISGVEAALNVPLSMASSWLDGFGVMLNYSNTSSSVNLPAGGFSTQNVNTATIPLPGLSKEVTNLRAYYEKNGFQVAVARRSRSDFLGSISDYQDKAQLVYVKGESQVDVQVSYEFQTGMLKGLSLLAQGSNLNNAEFQQYDASNGNVTATRKYGASYAVGVNYKF